MAKKLCFALTLLYFCFAAGNGLARTLTFTDPDLMSLDHYDADLWGVDVSLNSGEYITNAKIEINQIYNWRWEENDLWLNLLEGGTSGVTHLNDPVPGFVNYFGASGTELENYHNLPGPYRAIDLEYVFTTSELLTLSNFISADSNIGLGFDADCHFYNSGVYFTIETATNEVPEPATMILFGTGLASLAGFQRLRKK